MLKRWLAILLVVAVVFSFSSIALASGDTLTNGSTAQLVRNDAGYLVQVYVPAAAKYGANGNSRAANNPIDVAGKKWF